MKHLYPSWRYHATLGSTIVQTPEDDKALGEGWTNSPATAHEALAAVPEPAVSSPVPPVVLDPPVASTYDQKAETVWNTTAPNLIETLESLDGRDVADTLNEVRTYELSNPKRARKGVLDYIDGRLAKIAAAQIVGA